MELMIKQTLQQALTAHKAGQLEEAERHYRTVLQTYPTHPDVNHNLGLIVVSANKTEAALPLFETALEENEIVVSIEFCIPKKASYMKFPNPASRYAMAGVYVSVFDDSINVAVTGASENGVFKWTEMEEALSSEFTLEKAKSVKLSSEGIMSDIHADAAYRANLVNVMAIRAIENLI